MKREIRIDSSELCRKLHLLLADTHCIVETNCDAATQGLRNWMVKEPVDLPSDFSMRLLVTSEKRSSGTIPHFRGRRHIVIASFGGDTVFTFDLLRRQITGVVPEEVAADHCFWDHLLLPIALGVLGPAIGLVPVHCACLAIDGLGILMAGESGAGKSTLAVALAQQGFDFISDDWTYLAVKGSSLNAHGMSVPAKLLPDAVSHFPFLGTYTPKIALNQELAYEVPMENLRARVLRSCEPRWFFFLERIPGRPCSIEPISSVTAQHYVERSVERLPPELSDMFQSRSRIVGRVSSLSCFKLSYGGPPDVAVRGLRTFCAMQRESIPV